MGRLVAFILAMAVWTMLTWSADIMQVTAGVIVSAIGAYMFGDVFDINYRKYLQPGRYAHFIFFLAYFIYDLFAGGIKMARYVLSIKLPDNTGIVKISTGLKGDVSRTMLANTITLAPDTMTIDVIGGNLFVHWLDVRAQDTKKATQIISMRTEKYIREIFE